MCSVIFILAVLIIEEGDTLPVQFWFKDALGVQEAIVYFSGDGGVTFIKGGYKFYDDPPTEKIDTVPLPMDYPPSEHCRIKVKVKNHYGDE